MQELICATFTYILTYVELKLCVHWAMTPTLFLLVTGHSHKRFENHWLRGKRWHQPSSPSGASYRQRGPWPRFTDWLSPALPRALPGSGSGASTEGISHSDIIRKEPRTPEKPRMFKVEGRRCCMAGADVKHQMGPGSRCSNKKFITVQENNKTSLIPWNNSVWLWSHLHSREIMKPCLWTLGIIPIPISFIIEYTLC